MKCKCTFGNGSSVFTALLQNIAEGACLAGYKRAVMQGGAWVGRGEGCRGFNFFSLLACTSFKPMRIVDF